METTRKSYHEAHEPATPRPLFVLETCPDCGARLRLRKNRKTGDPFVACSAWPACDFTEEYDERLQHMAMALVELETRLDNQGRSESKAISPEVLDRGIRELVFEFHPDRRSEPVTATEVCARLNLLRDMVRAAA